MDEVSRGTLDLTTLNGGSFLGYSNAWVGAGNTGSTTSAGFPISWSDHFQVGAPEPEPASFALAGLAAVGLAAPPQRLTSAKPTRRSAGHRIHRPLAAHVTDGALVRCGLNLIFLPAPHGAAGTALG